MSRVGKKPIPLPKGVEVKGENELTVKGPKGTLTVPVPPGISLKQENGTILLLRDGDHNSAKHGLTRALLGNAVTGVSTGFVRELDIVGTGYRAETKGRVVVFSL